jgi:hypothetical protein
MKRKIIRYIGVMLLIAAPHLSYGQYFQGLYDNASTYDWGWCISRKADGNYFMVGWNENATSSGVSIFNMTISADGSNMISRKTTTDANRNIGIGNPGQLTQMADGGYLVPLILQWPGPVSGSVYSAGGLIKYDAAGDTVFLKTYTDTSIYLDYMYNDGIMPDGGYIVAGGRELLNRSFTFKGYLVRTNGMGDSLWTHTYQKDTNQVMIINTIPLSDGRIVVGASSIRSIPFDDGFSYLHGAPWFMVLDNMGNILKDTIYNNNMMLGPIGICNSLYQDANGGYIHIGVYESYIHDPSDPYNIRNFPAYIVHLDTNFRVTWTISLGYSEKDGHRQGMTVHQLHDSSYIVLGDVQTLHADMGWAAKISRAGKIIWSRSYSSDTTKAAYLRDMVENPDGSLVFLGATFNDTCNAARNQQDAWLLGVDSNGCENGFCAPVGVKASPGLPKGEEVISMFPNPARNELTLQGAAGCDVKIFNLAGQEVLFIDKLKMTKSNETVDVRNLIPGVYIVRVISRDGVVQHMRFVKE